MKTRIILGLCTVLGLGLLAQQLQAVQAVPAVDARQAQDMVVHQAALLLDVREPSEYAAIHAPNARLIPLGEVSQRLKELEGFKERPIAVICRSGRRSAKAVSMLQEAGFTQVSNVRGGIQAWEQAGLEVIRQQ